MKYAKFSDDFLSYFRLDDNGETLVLTDKRGYTRAVELLPYEERPQGEWIINEDIDFGNFKMCSNCGENAEWLDGGGQFLSNFCPNCGANMRKGGAK
jgi:ribosomal protein S27AE